MLYGSICGWHTKLADPALLQRGRDDEARQKKRNEPER